MVYINFKNGVRSLNIKSDESYLNGTENMSDPIDIAINEFVRHATITAIKQNFLIDQTFNLPYTGDIGIRKGSTVLNKKKNDVFVKTPSKYLQ